MGFIKSSPCQAYLYLFYNPIPHHIPPLQLASNPCATLSGYRRQLGIQSRPFANLSIYPYPYPLLSLSIYYFPFAFRQSTSHHHHCSCKTHRPVSHPTSVFTTPRTHTKYKQVKSLYPHYLLAPSDPHFHFLLDRKTSTPDPCAPLLFDFDLEDNSQSFGHFTLFRHLLLSFLRCTLVFNGLHFGLSSSNTSSSPSPCPRARTHPHQIHHPSRLTSSPGTPRSAAVRI